LETFNEVEFRRIAEPETGAFLEGGALAIEMFRDEFGGDGRGASASDEPEAEGDRETDGNRGCGMQWEHQSRGHTCRGGGDAEFAEGAIPSPSSGE
jgi:hypothetical protein